MISVTLFRSRRTRARVDDGPNVFAAQRRGEPARNESVHDLHALQVARGRHDVQQRPVDRQRAHLCCEIGGARFADQVRRRSDSSMWIGVIDTIDVLDDREPSGAQRVGDEKGTRVRPVRRDA